MEQMHTWTDNNGKPEDAVSRDRLLTNLTIYRVTQTATSSARIYYEANRLTNGIKMSDGVRTYRFREIVIIHQGLVKRNSHP